MKMKKYRMLGIMIWNALLRRRSRMLIALLAVAIGATIVSGLITIYYDVPRQMGREFRSYGANLVLTPAGDKQLLPAEAVSKINGILPPDKLVGMAPYLYDRVKINEQPLMLAGTDFQQVKKVSPYWQVRGQWPESPAEEIMLGAETAELLQVEPGQEVTLAASGSELGRKMKVTGIVRTGGSEENFIFTDLKVAQQLLGTQDNISVMQVSIIANEAELTAFTQAIAGATPDIVPRIVKRVAQSEETVLGKLQALVYLVTIVVLLLTMICVATTMMAVVTERRKEIGLKKALGAENRGIVLEFLGEGMTLGALGGLLGVVLGFFFAQAVSVNVFGREISFQPFIAFLSLVVSIAVTGAACLIPVKIATDVEPAIVLRGE